MNKGLGLLRFDDFVARHGEIVAQALLENVERHEGVSPDRSRPLEERWCCVMRND